MQMKKKGQVFDQMTSLGVGVAGLTITLVVVFLILSNVKSNTSVAADGYATNATSTLQNAVKTIPDWIPLVIIAVIGAILIGLVSLFRR